MSIKTVQPHVPFWHDFYATPEDDKSTLEVRRSFQVDSNTNSAERNNPAQKKCTFEIKKRETYLDMHYNAGFRWRGKVVKKSDRTAIAVSSFNDFLGVVGSMFTRIRTEMSGKEIELSTDVFLRNCFQSHLENRLTDPIARDQSGYFPETDVTEPNGRLGGVGYNGANAQISVGSVYIEKLKMRNGVTRKYATDADLVDGNTPSSEFELFIPLRHLISFFRDNVCPIVSNSIKIELELNEENVIKGFQQTVDAGANTEVDCLLQTTFLQLEFDEYTPADDTQKMLLEKRLGDSKIYRMWKRYESETFGFLQPAQGSVNTLLGSYTSRPDRVYVAVQCRDKAQKLNQVFNYSTFDLLNYESVELRVNGSSVCPQQKWEYDIPNHMVIQLYNEYVRAQRSYSNEDSGLMPINVWRQNYPILCFDLRHLGDSVFKNNMSTQIYFQAKWSATPVVHPYATMLGQDITIHANDALPAESQQYQFVKHVEVPCAVTFDINSGSMLVDSLIN